MKAFSTIALAAVPFVVAHGHDDARHLVARQAASSASGAASATASGAVTSPAATGAAASSSATFSLASSESTAVPLSSITASATTNSASLPTLSSTFSAGAEPTAVSGAPPLPERAYMILVACKHSNPVSIVNLKIADYPTLDRTPPTDSDEVKGWIEEVKNSGVDIPNITPNVAGGCAANAEAAKNESNCWWTCGGCTRDTDIVTCPEQKTWGLTFDDGPSPYTPALLNYLEEKDVKAAFYAVGSRVLSYPETLRYEYMTGHQIGAHTWAHPALTTLTNDEIIAEFGWTRKVIREVIGVSPNTFRPPYGDVDDRVRAIAKAMGMYPVMWTRISAYQTFDTHDFDIQNGAITVEGVLQEWNYIMNNASTLDTGFITLEHDLYQQTVEVSTGYILPDAIAQDYKLKTVVDCLNQPLENAYVETNDNKTNPPAASGSGVVTLSSGAPGSAQATGAGSSGDSSGGDGAMGLNVGASAALGMSIVALVAGITLI
ncbi:carbohydrate esterase family 4 protein [Cylindrobasidium torrendii FP15055 ss-10]|uniref:chitin deacetylase n=1 Tax=Cylindrobasidium torrendii FP15055 ss-10 TaxID=1314674 RepID=A0A0D7BD22_9AGAR|nr:carbohydrate esterase family 4 protein [Cylindrobasidium torrendii FP15055 ss-10]